jgi:hypothetical protein
MNHPGPGWRIRSAMVIQWYISVIMLFQRQDDVIIPLNYNLENTRGVVIYINKELKSNRKDGGEFTKDYLNGYAR